MKCGGLHQQEKPRTCPACGSEGVFDVELDYARIEKEFSARALRERGGTLWRYRELLPVGRDLPVPHLPVGWTPILRAPGLARSVGIADLFLKDEGRNPTGSLKDRGSAIAVVRAREEGTATVACASTGNAASSLAGFAAAAGLKSVLFVPATISESKLAQLLVYGATVFRVKGTYEAAYDLCEEACERFGWYDRNSAVNPFLVEGEKTVGLEIAERLGDEIPDWVAVPVGDGSTIAATWKGLSEGKRFGLVKRLPKLLGVQAEGASPIVQAFEFGKEVVPAASARSVADSIAVAAPRDWRKALRAVKDSGGAMISVSDVGILVALRDTAQAEGVFAEPAAAATVAGLREAVENGIVSKTATALAILTGTGLKDVRPVLRAVGDPIDVDPKIDAVAAALEEAAPASRANAKH